MHGGRERAQWETSAPLGASGARHLPCLIPCLLYLAGGHGFLLRRRRPQIAALIFYVCVELYCARGAIRIKVGKGLKSGSEILKKKQNLTRLFGFLYIRRRFALRLVSVYDVIPDPSQNFSCLTFRGGF